MSALNGMDINLIFEKDKAQEYNLMLDNLWRPLVRANTSLLIAEKILNFPTATLFGASRGKILDLIAVNFIEFGALTVINMLTDQVTGSLTINSLIEWCKSNCKNNIKTNIEQILETLKTDYKKDPLLKRAVRLRHKVLAHLDEEHALRPELRKKAQLSLEQIKKLLEMANDRISQLCIGHGKSMLPLEYSPFVRSDIEWLLDIIAKNSHILNMPEEQPENFRDYWDTVSDSEKEIINVWRKRLKLPEIV